MWDGDILLLILCNPTWTLKHEWTCVAPQENQQRGKQRGVGGSVWRRFIYRVKGMKKTCVTCFVQRFPNLTISCVCFKMFAVLTRPSLLCIKRILVAFMHVWVFYDYKYTLRLFFLILFVYWWHVWCCSWMWYDAFALKNNIFYIFLLLLKIISMSLNKSFCFKNDYEWLQKKVFWGVSGLFSFDIVCLPALVPHSAKSLYFMSLGPFKMAVIVTFPKF